MSRSGSTRCVYCGDPITKRMSTMCNKCHNDAERRLKFRPDLPLMEKFLYGKRITS